MAQNWNDRVIALAAVFQAANLVEQLAKTGYVPSNEFKVAVESLFNQNPPSTLDVYGNLGNLQTGLTSLLSTLQRKPDKEHTDSLRYVMSLLHLQKKAAQQKGMFDVIGTRLEQSQKQLIHFSSTHDNIIANLADIYTDTLSTFRFRIQVMGNFDYLQQPRIANQIRVLLFSGIRATVLWRQLGGSRLHVIFQRKPLLHSAQELLKTSRLQA